jgi:hypothetical protein
MSVKYIRFTVQVHGLNLARESDAELLRLAIKKTVESVHPAGESNIYDNDVSVEMDEFAGRFNTEDVSQPAAPQPVVPAVRVWNQTEGRDGKLYTDGWNDCRDAMLSAAKGETVAECSGCNVVTARPDGGEIKWCCYCGRPTEDYNNE